MVLNQESARLQESGTLEIYGMLQPAPGEKRWRHWGPYLRERQWGTVREDYSQNGNALDYFIPGPSPIARLSLGRGRHGGD